MCQREVGALPVAPALATTLGPPVGRTLPAGDFAVPTLTAGAVTPPG